MKAISILAIALAVSTFTVNGAVRPAPWYDCSGKVAGNYLHPLDCTRYISCSPGHPAWEFDCGPCSNRPEACTPQNRLVYNATVDQCLWADETECFGDGEGEGTTTTDPPTEPTTTVRDDSEGRPQLPDAGGPCDVEDCKKMGHCQSYLRCNKTTGRWVQEECGFGLFWNPDHGGPIHEGNCDLLENLSQEIEGLYRSDPQCLACFWEAAGECKREYRYQAAHQSERNVMTLSCAEGLVFSQESETCQRCQDVRREDGTPCC